MVDRLHELALVQASVEINGGCNYTCKMCPQSEGREKPFLRKLPMRTFERIVEELRDAGCEKVNLQGSGEPLMSPDFIDYVRVAHRYGLRTSIVTNGFRLTESLSEQILQAGMAEVRVSVVGYDRDTYREWMGEDAFDRVFEACRRFLALRRSLGASTRLSSYHLVLDPAHPERDVERYLEGWVRPLGIEAEIWQMHNWSGNYVPPSPRRPGPRRSCGRPFAPYLNVRAGGLAGEHAAVVPCCMVLGNDSAAVLGHLSSQSIREVWDGPAYRRLRQAHRDGAFDSVEYCRDCDQLYDAPDSLVWTNIAGKAYGQIKNDPRMDLRSFTPGPERA